MESFIGHVQKENTRTKSSRKINMCDTAGTGMGRQRPSDIYKNTTWLPRLEWRC